MEMTNTCVLIVHEWDVIVRREWGETEVDGIVSSLENIHARMICNPESSTRIISAVRELLNDDTLTIGDLSFSLDETSIFTEEELEVSDKILGKTHWKPAEAVHNSDEIINVWEWTFVDIYKRWTMEERYEIFHNLNMSRAHLDYNPASKLRVISVVSEALESELAGKITTKELIDATDIKALFTEEERKNTDELFARSLLNHKTDDTVIN